MKLSGLVIILSVIIAFVLTIGGAYISIDNLITPQGNLFEGVVLFSMGIISFLLLVVASNIGTTIKTFTDVYVQQVEMQQIMNDHFQKNAGRPRSIGDILDSMQSSVSITNLKTGETINPLAGDSISEKVNEMLRNALKGSMKNPERMNREQLEQELANAVKKDDFEKATEIKELLRKLSEGDDDSEKKGE